MSSEVHNDPDATVVIASQIVRDVKVSAASASALPKDTDRFRRGLLHKNYIPGDKLSCKFHPFKFDEDGALIVEIYGGMLKGSERDGGLDPHFFQPFHLDLKRNLSEDDIRKMIFVN